MSRHGISTSMRKLASAIISARKYKEKRELIAMSGGEKIRPKTYELKAVEYNENNLSAKIVFQENQDFRTIERYVTQNYQKYPIYSSWKTKSRSISKTVFLRNRDLENLNNHTDELIKMFSSEIILEIGNEDLYPSWLLFELATRDRDENIDEMKNSHKTNQSMLGSRVISVEDETKKANLLINKSAWSLKYEEETKTKIDSKLKKISRHKPNIIFYILSFSILYLLNSPRRKNKLINKLNIINDLIKNSNQEIDSLKKQIQYNIKNVDEIRKRISDDEMDFRIKLKNEQTKFEEITSRIVPLPLDLSEKDEFIPLKILNGFEKRKIIGVYIIKNNELDKYYVGQSKDVMKRIRIGHFNGTKPKNANLFEDYFTSCSEKREELFSIKIIPLSTKDELDSKEKELIAYYKSDIEGYNRTSGNS